MGLNDYAHLGEQVGCDPCKTSLNIEYKKL